MASLYFRPPDDPQITGLPDQSEDPDTDRFLKHLKKHGYTNTLDLSDQLGMTYSKVRSRVAKFSLTKKLAKISMMYWYNRGYRAGSFEDFDAETVEWLTYHVVGDDTLAKAANRILRGDTKPHPRCGCSFCIRSRK